MMEAPQTRKEKIDNDRWGCILLSLVVVAPHLSNQVADAAAWIGIAAFVFVREGVVSAAERLWLFVTRQ